MKFGFNGPSSFAAEDIWKVKVMDFEILCLSFWLKFLEDYIF